MPNLRALAFDVDGTTYPFSDDQIEGWKLRSYAFLREKLRLSDGSEVALAERYLETCGSVLSGMVADGHDVSPQEFFDRVHDVSFLAHVRQDPLLAEEMRGIGLPKFAFTNADKRHAAHALGRVGIQDQFLRMIHLETMRLRGKPHPDAFDTLIAQIRAELGTSIQPDEIVLIEDSVPNLRQAKIARLRTMHVHHGVPSADPSIDVGISVLREIRAGIASLLERMRVA